MLFAVGNAGKEDFLAVVMQLGVADAAGGLLENRSDLLRLDVVDAQLSAPVGVMRVRVLILSVVADVGVPVPVDAGLAKDKENLVRHAGFLKFLDYRQALVLRRFRFVGVGNDIRRLN